MNQDTVTKLLRPGEQILWSSMSNPGKLMDEKNKQRNTRWFIIVGAVFAVLMFFMSVPVSVPGRTFFPL